MMEAGGLGDKVIEALINKASKGDVNAIKEIFDRIDGKVTQEVDQKTEIRDNRLDLSKLTDQELDFLERIRNKAGASEEEPS